MSVISNVTLRTEIKSFGGRIFELTRPIGDEAVAREMRRSVADASRAYVRAVAEADGRRARRALEVTFKALTDTVRGLDGLARGSTTEVAVLASTLAAEGTGLCEEVYDLISPE
jgi:hypothetical protein